MRARFVLTEIGIGIRRNLGMSIAVVITMAISMAALGAGLLFQQQVNMMRGYFTNELQVQVFLCSEHSSNAACNNTPVTQAQRDDIESTLNGLRPLVETVNYVDQQQAYKIFKEEFADAPDLWKNTSPSDLPESFAVKLKDPSKFSVISDALSGKPGVDEVQDEHKVINKLFSVLNTLRNVAWILCGVMVLAALLLVGNAIRVAAFNRRREIGIMRLVGSSNLYIQLPFVLEGVVAGIAGCALGAAILAGIKYMVVDGQLRPSLKLFGALVDWPQTIGTFPALFIVAIVLSALASIVSLRGYLRV